MILSCLTDRHAIQVSDRRITRETPTGSIEVLDDERNKVVLVCNRFAISFSGIAELEGIPTDEWILDVAGALPHSLQRIVENLASRAEAVVRRLRLPPEKQHLAFVAIGWATGRDAPVPCAISISNALDDAWRWKESAQSRFRIRPDALADGAPFRLIATGVQLSHGRRFQLEREINQCVQRRVGPKPFIDFMVAAVRQCGSKAVGKNLLAVSVPRAGLDKGAGVSILMGKPIDESNPQTLYFHEGDDDGRSIRALSAVASLQLPPASAWAEGGSRRRRNMASDRD
jgi:hypothetical protein